MAKATIPFPHKLVLNRFMLSLFGADVYNLDIDPFREMSRRLIDESLELTDKEGNSAYYNEILGLLPNNSILTPEALLEFDENIQRHTRQINEKRYPQIRWKYFQYLTLLFTEVYLDWYFRDPDDLLETLNQHLDRFNQTLSEWGEKTASLLKPFTQEQLKKLAYWNATGSGKTLLMHVNLLQYKHYLKKHRKEHELNRIIVLTPNEGLTHQHLDEFKLSGITASEFSKVAKGSMRYGDSIIDVIDMNKLKEEGKKKTVSVDQFEQNNLVLIDEGHRGAKGDVWSDMRERLAREGFTFEYSATLGQAVGSTPRLADEYAKAILFDYSYRNLCVFSAKQTRYVFNYDKVRLDACHRTEKFQKQKVSWIIRYSLAYRGQALARRAAANQVYLLLSRDFFEFVV